MSRPHNIRSNLIAPNKAELECYGILHSINANSGKRGRPSWTFYLNREQAILVAVLSRLPKAADVREEIIMVFTAYQDGHLTLSETGKIALPNFANPAEAARAWGPMARRRVEDKAPTPHPKKTAISITSQTGPYREKGKTVSN